MGWVRSAAVIGFAWAAAAISGCAIYSETRDKQGQAVKEAWSKIDLAQQIAVPRKNLLTLLEEQLAIEDELWLTRRTSLARALAHGGTIKSLETDVSSGLARVVGVPNAANELDTALRNIAAARENLRGLGVPLAAMGLRMPTCEEMADAEARQQLARNPAIAGQMTAADPLCRTLQTGIGGVRAAGELGTALKALKDDEASLKKDREASAEAKKRFDRALAEYEAAVPKLLADPKSATARAEVDKALDQLKNLATFAQDDPFSIEFLSEARQQSIDRFFTTYQAVLQGKEVKPEDASRTAIALAIFPDLIDKARIALANLEKPNLVPLTLQKSLELARLEAAQRDVALRKALLALRQQHVDALVDQALSYRVAAQAIAAARAANPTLETTDLKLAMASSAPLVEWRQKLWVAAARHLHAEGRARAEAAKTSYRILAVSRQRALSYAESNLAQWRALVDPTVELAAEFGASGLKSKDLVDLFNSLTLLSIGVGVNK